MQREKVYIIPRVDARNLAEAMKDQDLPTLHLRYNNSREMYRLNIFIWSKVSTQTIILLLKRKLEKIKGHKATDNKKQ